MLIGILEFFSGGLFFNWLRSRRYQQWEKDLESRELAVRNMLTQIQTTATNKYDPLNDAILRDAMARECRAKAALRSVLRENGCDEDSIQSVMNAVDNSEEGDL